jgi:hypothetical protein
VDRVLDTIMPHNTEPISRQLLDAASFVMRMKHRGIQINPRLDSKSPYFTVHS